MEAWVDFGGHYILIGYRYLNGYVTHKNQESILIRGWLGKDIRHPIIEIHSVHGSLDRRPWPEVFWLLSESISSRSVDTVRGISIVLIYLSCFFFATDDDMEVRRMFAALRWSKWAFHRYGVGKIWKYPFEFGCVVEVWNLFRARESVISSGQVIRTIWPERKVNTKKKKNNHFQCSFPGKGDVHGRNSMRLAEVWMDDYKRFYYMHRRDLQVRQNEQFFSLNEKNVCLGKRLWRCWRAKSTS